MSTLPLHLLPRHLRVYVHVSSPSRRRHNVRVACLSCSSPCLWGGHGGMGISGQCTSFRRRGVTARLVCRTQRWGAVVGCLAAFLVTRLLIWLATWGAAPAFTTWSTGGELHHHSSFAAPLCSRAVALFTNSCKQPSFLCLILLLTLTAGGPSACPASVLASCQLCLSMRFYTFTRCLRLAGHVRPRVSWRAASV